MNPIIKAVGVLWMNLKWRISEKLAYIDWMIPVSVGLLQHGVPMERLTSAKSLEDVVDVFRGLWHWRADPFFQVWDRIYPPIQLLERGGDDCDGWAMAHAQAVAVSLGLYGWTARIVSYLADKWWLSHHFAAAIDPQGLVWAIQPQPTETQDPNAQLVYGPYTSLREAAEDVASWYGVKVEYLDIRTVYGDLVG